MNLMPKPKKAGINPILASDQNPRALASHLHSLTRLRTLPSSAVSISLFHSLVFFFHSFHAFELFTFPSFTNFLTTVHFINSFSTSAMHFKSRSLLFYFSPLHKSIFISVASNVFLMQCFEPNPNVNKPTPDCFFF
ncbi:hypothetical protein VNO77_36648 [Canavalia gladiata]|uniref:Transmembrane protein n=1 Tax=Canavalia gladiata TaxID=3824 RepID=A0AAN9K7F7_CANGL